MLKNLAINLNHQALIQNFITYLRVMGYAKNKKADVGVRELLWRMEGQNKRLEDLTKGDIQNHYEYLSQRPNKNKPGGLSPATIRSYFFILKLFFGYAEKIRMINSNPMSAWSLPPYENRERQVLSKSEIKQLYEACKNHQERAILGLYYGCGLRRSEGEKLNQKDIDYQAACLYVRSGKGWKRRVVPVADIILHDFKNYKYYERAEQETRHTRSGDKKAFMLNKMGTRLKGDGIRQRFKTILKRTLVSETISLHHLRHSIATHLLASGMSIEQVRDFLGHQYLESTQIYTRVKTSQLKI